MATRRNRAPQIALTPEALQVVGAMFGATQAQNVGKSDRAKATERRVGVISALEVAQLMRSVDTGQDSEWFVDDETGRKSQWRIVEGEDARKFGGQFLLVRALPTEADRQKAREAQAQKSSEPDERDSKIDALAAQVEKLTALLSAQVGGTENQEVASAAE